MHRGLSAGDHDDVRRGRLVPGWRVNEYDGLCLRPPVAERRGAPIEDDTIVWPDPSPRETWWEDVMFGSDARSTTTASIAVTNVLRRVDWT